MNELLLLSDDLSLTGHDYASYKEAITKINDCTGAIPLFGKEITVLSRCDIETLQQKGKETYYVFDEDRVTKFLAGEKLYVGTFPTNEIMEEINRTTGLAFKVNYENTDDKIFIGKNAIPQIGQHVGVYGVSVNKNKSMIRDLHLADVLITRNPNFCLIYREQNGIKKAFSAVKAKNGYIPLTTPLPLIESFLEKGEIYDYQIKQNFNEINIDFPNLKADGFTGGIRIKNGDTGKTSFTIYGYLRKDDCFVFLFKESFKHSRNFETIIAEINPEIVYEKISKKVNAFNSSLNFLKSIETTDSYEDIKDVYKQYLEKVLSPLPLKWRRRVIDCIESSIICKIYNHKEIVCNIMMIPEIIKGIDEVDYETVQLTIPEIASI